MSLVSIIVPSYRQPQFLGRAIESCLEQDHTDLEIIVVDDRSRDSSLGLALAWQRRDSRVRVIEATQNGGLGKARNIGIAKAEGEFLCFLDSDDYLLPRSISARLDAFPAAEAEHGAALAGVYGDWQHVAESVDAPVIRQPRQNMTIVSKDTYTGENVFICSAPLVRRARVLDAGGFPEGLKMLEDFAMWARMIAAGAVFAPVRHVVATYRQRPNSMLRGDGAVLMADHVNIINQWMARQGAPLADGGALTAWMSEEPPFSHGRMSWNVPSMLGSFGGAPGAASVREASSSESSKSSGLDDFMEHPVATGLEERVDEIIADPARSGVALLAHNLRDSVAAVAVAAEVEASGGVAQVYVADPTDWTNSWPLPLVGLVPRSIDELDQSDTPQLDLVDLADRSHRFVTEAPLLTGGARRLWPHVGGRSGAIVYVPDVLWGHPALDAWVSTALHVAAEADLDPVLVADPNARDSLGGWRSSILSLDLVLGSRLVICPEGEHLELIEALAPVAIFDPFAKSGTAPSTANELASLVAEISRSHM